MSRRQKIVVIGAGVLILVAFVAALANPGSGNGPVGWLGGVIGDAAAAAPEELAPQCREPDGRLVFGGSCTIAVAPSTSDLRLVTLVAEQPISVSAPSPVGDFTVESEVAAGETVRVALGSDGAEIAMVCDGDQECVVRIGESDG